MTPAKRRRGRGGLHRPRAGRAITGRAGEHDKSWCYDKAGFAQVPAAPPFLMTADKLTHFDSAGQAHMVDVGDKAETRRVARAAGRIAMLPATLDTIAQGTAKKGDVLGIARIAAIQAA